jgi:hypothetical protein
VDEDSRSRLDLAKPVIESNALPRKKSTSSDHTMSTVDYEAEHVPDQLVDQLVKGYDALTAEVKALNERRQELENKLSWAKQQV